MRVSASPSSIPANRVQLLTSSSKFGLTFVATENGKYPKPDVIFDKTLNIFFFGFPYFTPDLPKISVPRFCQQIYFFEYFKTI